MAADVYVRDDDDAQELELNFGKDGTNDADAAEGDILKFTVKRRSTDTGNPARFTVRVETDRSGPDLVLDDWTEDTGTGNLYREYSYELTGTDTQVEQEIPVTENGEAEDDWTYTAKILPLQDYQGNDLESATEALYWTAKSGFRETEIEATDSGASNGAVTLSTNITEVQEGGEVPFTLTRVDGQRAEEVTVQVKTWEPNRERNNGTNPSDQTHTVTIAPWEATASFSVNAYVDTATEPDTDTLTAEITSVSGGGYQVGSPSTASVEINDPPGSSAAVTIAVDSTGINEGQTATFTFTRTGSNTAQPLTVNIRVDDNHGFLRGNHWEAAPEIPTQIVFAANETSKALELTALEDERDTSQGAFKVTVLPGTGCHPGNTGTSTEAGVIVVDNDLPQELTLQWGWIDFGDSDWEPGQSYLECNGTCTNGPAEGTWHYTDGRSFDFYNEIETYWPAHFQVSRRNNDTDRTAHLTVRVEHDRGWLSPRHSDWTLDPVTGKHYKDFPLTLTGNQRSVVVRIEVLDNSQDIDWSFAARILPMTDTSTGTELDASVEAQYWTFSGQRNRDIQASNAGTSLQINLLDPQPHPVPEGDQVQFPVQRMAGYALEPVAVQVRTWEPNRRTPGGTNPTDQVHTLTFPALPLTSTFIDSRDIDQTQTITVTTEQDSEYEPSDRIQAEVVHVSHAVKGDDSKLEQRALIRDDDRATIALSSDTTSITEGETVTFTLTRTNNTAEELQVGVTLDDPGGFLEGNFPGEEVTVPSVIAFGAGDATATLAVTPPDDWRDIADSTLTLTLENRREYEISGADSITVDMADNDTAPQVSIGFEPAEVEEGQNLVLWINRTGQDTNPIEVPVTVGPVGDQRYTVFRLGTGITRYGLSYASVDDHYKGPDIHYEATLHPQDPEFWVPSGGTTVSGAILDNDLYTVGIERLRIIWDEGRPIRFRVFHDGHTGAAVPVNLLIEETGNAVSDDLLGPRPASIPYGTNTLTPVIYTEANDGSDGDAIFTVRLQPGDGYEIDPDHDIAAMIVKDLDPLPVISFRDNRVQIPEAAGTGAEVWVELESAVPTTRDVWVNYEVRDTAAADHGEDFLESSGRLQFAAGETSKAIPVEILQDRLAEADEQFSIFLKTPQFAVLKDGQPTLQAVAIIVDDEPHVSITIPNDTVTEGTDATFNLERTEDTSDELTVWVRVVKSAPFNTTTQEEVVFAAGSATAQFNVPTDDDDERLGTYTIRVGLLYPPIIGKPQTYWREGTLSHTVTVRDNELERVWLIVDEGRVQEGDPVTFTLRRPFDETESLEISLDIEAPAGYTTGTIPSTVIIPAGADSVQTSIQTVDDSTAEENGELTVTILDGTGYRPAYPNTFTFTIFDDDGALPGVRVNRTTAWVDEGEDVVFKVIRSGSTTDPLDARLRLYRLRSRATQAELDDPTRGVTTPVHLVPLDHEEITVNFPAGTNTVTVTRSTTDDSFNYGNSTYHAFVLADEDDDYTAYYEHTAEVWVQDDDRPVVTIANAPTTTFYGYPGAYYPGVSRTNDSIIVSATLTRTGDATGLLPVAVRNQQTTRWPAPKQDETGVLSTAIDKDIQPGEATSVFNQTGFANVNALGRSRTLFLAEAHNCPDDPEECGYGPQYTLGTAQEATVQVRSNFMGVRIQANQSPVTEGTAATFTLERHGGKPDAMTRPLTVRVEVTQRGDFITGTTPSTVTFPANQSSLTLTVPTENDTLDEASGRVSATILIPTSLTDDEQSYETGIYPGTPWDIHSAFIRVNDDDTTNSSISVSDQEVDEEAGTVTFTVSLDQANNDNPVSFDWTTRDGTATAGQDYQANSGSHTFAVGETSQDFTVTVTDDTTAEGDETFDVVLSNLSQAQAADTTGTITIRDNELNHGVTIENAPSSVQEGQEIAILLRRLTPTAPTGTEQADAPCFRAGGQAVMCFDPDEGAGNTALTLDLEVTQTGSMISQALPATATFQSGSRFAAVRIQTDDDSLAEAAGSLTLTILNGQGYTPEFTGAVSTETVAIYDNDLQFSIADAEATEGTDTTVDFTVSLNSPAPEQLTVVASTTDGEATSQADVTPTSLGRDFEAKTETITFLAGERTKTFSVGIEDDTFHERHETFTVQLSDPSGNAVLADPTATGTIRNDDAPLVASVTRAYAVVNEDHAGAVRFTVNLTHATTTASERNPAVAWEITAGTATEEDDYLTTDGKVFFPVGSTIGFIDVELVDDEILEQELETFTVDILETGSRQVVISTTDNSFEASIRDDETFSAKITADAESVAEGEDAGFTVTLTGGTTTQAVQVNFETGGTATAGPDYNTPIGNLTFPQGDRSGQSGTLTIAAGASSGTITFPIIRDQTEDDGETIEVETLNASHGARRADMDAGDEMASTTILDQDMIAVSLNEAPRVTEGTAATFTVTLSGASDERISVGWSTRDGTAQAGQDYDGTSGTVAISAGSTSATFTVQTTQDTLAEEDETFTVILDEATSGTGTPPEMVPLGVTQRTATILDDDTAPSSLTIEVTPDRVGEGDPATDLSVTVTLGGTTQLPTDTPLNLAFQNRPGRANNATLDEDYTGTTANTVIPAGQSSVTATITITPVEDQFSEGDANGFEFARLNVEAPALSASKAFDVRILDNDAAPSTLTLSVSPDTVEESANVVALSVTGTLEGDSLLEEDAVVTVSLADGTATAGDDYESATATLTIPAGEQTATITMNLSVLEDSGHEEDETVQVTGAISGAITVNPAEVTIQDNDTAPTGISLQAASTPINEDGGATTVPVTATILGGGTLGNDTVVDLQVVALTATETDDYTATFDNAALTIPAGQYSATANLTITPVDDTLHEGDESIAVRGANTTPGLTVNGVRLDILDDDPAPTTIKLEPSRGTIPESEGTLFIEITATLEGDSTLTEDTRINTRVVRSDPSSRSNARFQLSPMVIPAGETSTTSKLLLGQLDDQVDDPDETIEITGRASNPDLTVLPTEIVIQDDDTAGVTVSTTSLTIDEGLSKRYQVYLDTEPTADVTLNIDVPAGAPFTVSPGSITFTSRNWHFFHNVRVRTVRDLDGDDEPAATITHSISSDDTLYRDTTVDSVTVTVRDTSQATVTVDPTTLTVNEGATGTYTVRLDTEPTGDVTVTIGGHTGTDVSPDNSTLTFTTSNWETDQTVTVTANQDDDAVNDSVTLSHTVRGGGYDGITADDVSVTVNDDDSGGISVSETTIEMDEGETETYTVVLDTQPLGDVEVTVAGHSGSDLDVSPTALTFTTANWDAAQTVTLTAGQDDDALDEDDVTLTHTAASTADSTYDGATGGDLVVSVDDDDEPGVTTSETEIELAEGATETYTIVLDTLPAGDVTVTITGHANTDLSGSPESLTFTTGDWNTAQTVTLTTGQDDDDEDEARITLAHTVASTADSTYNGLAADDLTVDITDNDLVPPGVTVHPTSVTVPEGQTAQYSVVLNTEPQGTVTITVNDPTDNTDVTTSPATLTFTTSNWSTPQYVTVTAATDSDSDDDSATITHDVSGYGDVDSVDDVAVTVTEGAIVAVKVSLEHLKMDIREGDSGVIRLSLDKDPERTVNIQLETELEGGASADDHRGVPQAVTFSPGETEASFTFTAVDDREDDDDEKVIIKIVRNFPVGVSGQAPRRTEVTILDNDKPESVEVSFGSATYTVNEGEGVQIRVKLSDDPERSLGIPLQWEHQDGATAADYTSLTNQVTTVSGRDQVDFQLNTIEDAIDDDGESLKLTFGTLPATTTLGSPSETIITIIDDDDAGITLSETDLTVNEGQTAQYTVVLDSKPTETVTVNITGHAGTDLTLDTTSLTFAPSAWNTVQTVTVTAGQDADSTDDTATLTHTANSDDTIYQDMTADLPVTTDDDETPQTLTVSFSAATYTVAEGGTATVAITLDPAPTSPITIPLTHTPQGGAAAGDYSGVPADITFNIGDTEKEFTFTATQDTDDDDGESVKLGFGSPLPTGVSAGTTDETVVSITDDDVLAVTVRFEQSTYTVAEGTNTTVKLLLSAAPERQVEITILKANQDGATSSDYSGVPNTLTFNSGDTEKEFTFTATADSDDDDGESVKLTISSSLPTGVTAGSPDETVISITDDDVPQVTVSFGQATYTVAEGNTVAIKVTLSADPERTVTIPLTKDNQDGATDSDYSGVPASVVLNSGDTEKEFTFTATQDSDDDDGEKVKLGFGSPLPTGVSAGSTNETVVSITDDDVPSVTVTFAASTYSVNEGSTVSVAVNLSADPERTVTIPLTKSNQDGASAGDYSGVPASLTFNSGDTQKTFDFSATADTVDDDGESVKLGFGSPLPAGVTAGSPNETVVSITDDDVPAVTVRFEQDTYTVAEGADQTVKLVLSAAPERELEITLLKANQDGATSSDYSGVPTSVTFSATDTEKTFTFTATQDTVDDDSESVKLTISATLPTGVTRGTPDETVVSITDDDVPTVNVSYSAASYTASEGGTVTIAVQLDQAPERALTIPLTHTPQDGASAADYSGVPASLSFAASDTEKEFTFTATDDSVDDDGESVKLGFGTLPTGVSGGTHSEATVSITDGDVPTVTVSYENATYSVGEGSAITIKVVLSADPEREVTIPISPTNQDGATDGDYSGVPNSLTFNSEDTQKTFDITATDDSVDDDGEKVQLGFGTLPAGVNPGTNSTATVNLTDNDDPAVTATFGAATYTVAEGNTVTVTLDLSADPERNVTIPITHEGQDGGTAADYSGVPATLTFGPGDTQKTFNLSATEDTIDDDGESVKISLGATLPTGVTAGSPNETVVSITDDDHPTITVSFGQASHTVTEGETTEITVTLSAAPERVVTIPLTHTPQDGAVSQDYSGVPTSIIFLSGETEKNFDLRATNDSLDDDGESVKLGFGATLPDGVSTGTHSETVVSITDNDDPAVTVSYQQASYTVDEGSSVAVKITLSADPERTVIIPITKSNQGGATDQDYSGVPASITFNSEDTEKEFSFTATNDSDNDDGESVKLGFGATLPTGVSAGTTNETTVNITDDYVTPVTVNFEESTYTVTEGSTVTVKVTLSANPQRTVTIPITKSNQEGASADDYSGVPADLTFNSGDTEKEFAFTATDDSADDDGESVKLGFGATLPTGVSAGTTDETVVSITDNDAPTLTVNYDFSTYTVAEGSTVAVKVVLSADPERTVTISLTDSGQDGASAADYSGVPASLTFNSGDTEKEFNFSATDDSVDDDGEKVRLGFQNLPSGVTAGNNPTTTVSITDNDDPAVTTSFAASTYTVTEGGTVAVTVNLSADPERTVSVPVNSTPQDGATVGDFSGPPTTLTLNSGDTSKSFDFRATDDSADDDGEKVKLTFGVLSTGVTAGSPNETVVSITDNDDPAVTVNFEQATYTVAEGNDGTVKVTLSADPERTVAVPISTSNQDGATAADYSGVPGTVTFNSGDTEQEFTFTATDDSADDDGESVKLDFGPSLPTGVSAGTTDETVVSITDDDTVGLTVSSTTFNVQEGGTTDFTVRLASQPSHNVTVTVESNDTGAATVSTGSLTFSAANWSNNQTVTVSGIEDADADDKVVTISLEAESDDTDYDELDASLTATVIDDDTASLVIDPTSLTVTEDGSGQFTVKLATQPSGGVTVTVESGDTGAATVSVASLSFTTSNWNTAQSVTVSGVDDSDTANESVTVSLTANSTDENYGGETGSVRPCPKSTILPKKSQTCPKIVLIRVVGFVPKWLFGNRLPACSNPMPFTPQGMCLHVVHLPANPNKASVFQCAHSSLVGPLLELRRCDQRGNKSGIARSLNQPSGVDELQESLFHFIVWHLRRQLEQVGLELV